MTENIQRSIATFKAIMKALGQPDWDVRSTPDCYEVGYTVEKSSQPWCVVYQVSPAPFEEEVLQLGKKGKIKRSIDGWLLEGIHHDPGYWDAKRGEGLPPSDEPVEIATFRTMLQALSKGVSLWVEELVNNHCENAMYDEAAEAEKKAEEAERFQEQQLIAREGGVVRHPIDPKE